MEQRGVRGLKKEKGELGKMGEESGKDAGEREWKK